MSRKIIYVTGTRADYGLMRDLLKTLESADDIDLSLCVTGMHLSPLYGNTIKEIEADNFRISGIIPVDVNKATPSSMAQSIGHELIAMVELFEKEQPDLLLVLGDRGEMLAAAIAAIHLNLPIVHFHGGERSGTIDEMVRHAISKLAHYHFVATQQAKERLIKMGESSDMIAVVGAPGLDELQQQTPCDRAEFTKKYQLDVHKKTALIIYHPVVQEYQDVGSQCRTLIEAALAADLQILCLEPNSDAGGQMIREVLYGYQQHTDLRLIKHLHRKDFLNCLAHCDLMLGNSSSGIIEAASFNLVVVNVGTRQNLRESGENVIHVAESYETISKGIHEALARKKSSYENIYGDGKTSERCYHLLKTICLDNQILNKSNAY